MTESTLGGDRGPAPSWRALACLAFGVGLLPTPAVAQAPEPVDSPKVLELTTYTTHPQVGPESDAIDIDHAKDGSGRLFVGTNEGKIFAFDPSGGLLGIFHDLAAPGVTPDFDPTLRFVTRGLSYYAFHPDYGRAGAPGEGKLYTLYRSTIPGAREPDYSGTVLPTKPGKVIGRFAVAEWTVDPDDPSRIDPTSYRDIIRFEISGPNQDNHSMGHIAFNPFVAPGDPDYGLLYIPLGDTWSGGGLWDWQHVQDSDNPFGKILRIDPLQHGDDRYAIPPDNPFADGGPLLDDDGNAEEIAAVGFRYPENLTFAREPDGTSRLLVFDIGADDYEELNLVDVGDNHGWPTIDGPVDVARSPERTSSLNPSPALTVEYPAAIYDHDFQYYPGSGSYRRAAIVGGFVASDPNDPDFQDQLVFADLPSGAFFHVDFEELLAADANDTQATLHVMYASIDGSEPDLFTRIIHGDDYVPEGRGASRGDQRFGVDERGRVFVTVRSSNTIYLTNLIAAQ